MSLPIIREIGIAFRNLNPSDVRSLADSDFSLGVLALDEAVWAGIVSYLIPSDTSGPKTQEAGRHILRMAAETDFARCEAGFSEPGVPHPAHFYSFDSYNPTASLDVLLEDHEDLWLPMGRRFPGARDLVVEKIIWKISKENALFTVATAVPNVIPSLVTLPWAAGEFASDTAFLTMNQVRMAFLIAGACDRDVGYQAQKAQIGSIVAAAFGWRALARELVSKVPAGGGLACKGLISLAGTYAVGKSLERLFRFGRGLTREERRRHYDDAYQRGRAVVEQIVQRVTRRTTPIHST